MQVRPSFLLDFFIFVWCRRIPSAYTLGIPKNDFWRLLASTAAPECERGAHSIRRQRQNVRGARVLYDGSASVQEGRAFYTTAAPECGSGAHPLGWQRQNASTMCYKALLYYDVLRCTIMGHCFFLVMCDIALREATVHYEVLCCTTRYYAALRCFRMPLLFGIAQHELSYLGGDLRRIPYRPTGPEEVV